MKKKLKIELIFTKDLKDKIIVFAPHKAKLDELPLTALELAKALLKPPKKNKHNLEIKR